MKSSGAVDLSGYVKALPLLLRNPQIALAPLLAAVANVLLLKVVPEDGGFIGFANASIVSLIAFVITSAGLAVAIAGADSAWRYGRAPFDDAVSETRRRAGDVLIAAIGFSFLVSIAGYIGTFLGGPGALVLTAVAFVLCIYMLPAAVIGGIPGGASLNVSVERVRGGPVAAILIAIVYFVGTTLGPPLVIAELEPLLLNSSIVESGVIASLIVALVRAVFTAYVALVLAKAYADASYGRFRRY